MYIVAFLIGFLFWKSCKFWRRLRALDYIWKSGVGFTLFYFTNLFVEIFGRKGSGTMIFIVSWCYGGLAMVIFILFWQGSYPPWWHHTGIGKGFLISQGGETHSWCLKSLILLLGWDSWGLDTGFGCKGFFSFFFFLKILKWNSERLTFSLKKTCCQSRQVVFCLTASLFGDMGKAWKSWVGSCASRLLNPDKNESLSPQWVTKEFSESLKCMNFNLASI